MKRIQKFSMDARTVNFSMLLLFFCAFIWGCDSQTGESTAGGNKDTLVIFAPNTPKSQTSTFNESSSAKQVLPPECPDIFPEKPIQNFDFELLSGTDFPIMHYRVTYSCHYELGYLGGCCRCKAMLDFLEISGDIPDSTEVLVSIPNAEPQPFSNAPVPIINDRLDLASAGLNVEVMDSLDVFVELPAGTPSQLSVDGGGLVVVINIDGGGK